jgi:hypothetical protein
VRFRRRPPPPEDERVLALARAIRSKRRVRLRATSRHPLEVHPVALVFGPRQWALVDARAPARPIPEDAWEDVNVSSQTFAGA